MSILWHFNIKDHWHHHDLVKYKSTFDVRKCLLICCYPMMAIFAVTLLVCDQIFGNNETWISLVPVTLSLTFSLLATLWLLIQSRFCWHLANSNATLDQRQEFLESNIKTVGHARWFHCCIECWNFIFAIPDKASKNFSKFSL